MYKEEYQRWRADMFAALTATRYSKEEAEIILDWFDRIKASGERDLIGDRKFDAMMIYTGADCVGEFDPDWTLYDNMSSRVWEYARYILKEHKRTGG